MAFFVRPDGLTGALRRRCAALLAAALLPSTPAAKEGGSTGGEVSGPDLADTRADTRQ
ncbi:hypothetical protein SCAB_34141 [Streptomyces scabiei 87.22]|uniref:Uncharacterized protein n=1 Tax=Streptomyces scabiei (strain 87.22) TaxID=680198 RepID=C9ZGR7_STRSW|nr:MULTISPECIES: hypothetical protein [Streptomyces]MDW8475374.1 hypothetical protein [Streptomyces scabiei]MDX2535770.1 hypothetical protein [Streptomyces scabiei]MDX2569303.1 hypothetical protein [Streptomyces scabiei]MDX2579009.1 hypothetical protein [Streptomyces scabiei]MDX2629490.1 hypothetical protein [Streptomyces scabiei]